MEGGVFVKANLNRCGPLRSLSVAKKDSYPREVNAHSRSVYHSEIRLDHVSNQRHLYFWCNGNQTVPKPPKKRNSKVRAGMKVLKAIRLRGGKVGAFIPFGSSECVTLKEQENW